MFFWWSNKPKCHARGSENHHDDTAHKCDSPKVNVWCALMKNIVIGPFFMERLQWWLVKLSQLRWRTLFCVMSYEKSFSGRWYTTSILPSCSCISWQGVFWSFETKRGTHSLTLYSPVLTHLDFFWGFVKDIFLSWKSAKCTRVAWLNHERCRVCLSLNSATEMKSLSNKYGWNSVVKQVWQKDRWQLLETSGQPYWSLHCTYTYIKP